MPIIPVTLVSKCLSRLRPVGPEGHQNGSAGTPAALFNLPKLGGINGNDYALPPLTQRFPIIARDDGFEPPTGSFRGCCSPAELIPNE